MLPLMCVKKNLVLLTSNSCVWWFSLKLGILNDEVPLLSSCWCLAFGVCFFFFRLHFWSVLLVPHVNICRNWCWCFYSFCQLIELGHLLLSSSFEIDFVVDLFYFFFFLSFFFVVEIGWWSSSFFSIELGRCLLFDVMFCYPLQDYVQKVLKPVLYYLSWHVILFFFL